MPRGRKRTVRRERPSFSASRKRLEVKYRDSDFLKKWVPRWFNDQDGRVERATEAGYEFVSPEEVIGVGDKEVHSGNTDIGSRVSRVVGRTDGNHAIRAYLMKLRIDWYREDQAEKEEQNALVDQAIRVGKAGGAEIENQYGQVRLSR